MCKISNLGLTVLFRISDSYSFIFVLAKPKMEVTCTFALILCNIKWKARLWSMRSVECTISWIFLSLNTRAISPAGRNITIHEFLSTHCICVNALLRCYSKHEYFFTTFCFYVPAFPLKIDAGSCFEFLDTLADRKLMVALTLPPPPPPILPSPELTLRLCPR